MATNRIYLYHPESMELLYMGKKFNGRWHNPPTQEQMQSFFDRVSGGSDNFIIAMEDSSECDNASTVHGLAIKK